MSKTIPKLYLLTNVSLDIQCGWARPSFSQKKYNTTRKPTKKRNVRSYPTAFASGSVEYSDINT